MIESSEPFATLVNTQCISCSACTASCHQGIDLMNIPLDALAASPARMRENS